MFIFLDFDLTLTENHSGGFPFDRYSILFNNKSIESKVFGLLSDLKKVHTIYIVSQGNQDQLINYFNMKNISLNIFGSSCLVPMGSNWAKIKADYICSELDKHKPKQHIFMDDDIRNILYAKNLGINTILANNGNPFENLKKILEELI